MELNQAPNEHKTLKLTPYKGKSWKDMSRTEKVVSIIALVFIGLVIFGIIGTAINSNTNYSTTTPGKNSNATPIPENSNQTTQSQPSQPQKPPSTLDMLWQALDNSGQSRDGVSISFTSASDMAPGYGSLVTFKKNYGETITHKIFIEDFLKGFVKYGQQAFKVPGVDHLDFEYDTQFTDDHGNTTNGDGMEFKISKTSFNSFKWQNLAGTTPYNAIVAASEYDYLAYSIRSDTDPSQVILILDY